MIEETNQVRTGETAKLPLWKGFVQKLIEDGLHYGMKIPTERLELELRAMRGTMKFRLDVSKIRTALIPYGFYLSGRGSARSGFYQIQPANDNVGTAKAFGRSAKRLLVKQLILAEKTDQNQLSPQNRERMQHIAEVASLRLAFYERPRLMAKLCGGDDKVREAAAKASERKRLHS